MDQKSWPAPAADAPNPLFIRLKKIGKKIGGLNPPACPLGWPHVANSLPPGATAWCAHRVYAWVYAWWSRGPHECYSITNDQRMERRHKTGPKRPIMPLMVTSCPSWSPHGHLMPLVVTSCPSWSPHAPRGHLMVASWSPHGRLVPPSWSPRGHLVVASWSPRAPRGHLMVTSWSPHGHLMVTSCPSWSPWVSVGGDLPANASAVRPVQTRGLRLVVTYMETPRPLSVFLRRTLDPYGGTRGKSHVYIPTKIFDPKIAPSSPRVHPEFTCSPPLALPLARVRGVEPRVAVLETAVLPLY